MGFLRGEEPWLGIFAGLGAAGDLAGAGMGVILRGSGGQGRGRGRGEDLVGRLDGHGSVLSSAKGSLTWLMDINGQKLAGDGHMIASSPYMGKLSHRIQCYIIIYCHGGGPVGGARFCNLRNPYFSPAPILLAVRLYGPPHE